jgi:xanthosine utilization system XapX-like protein
MSFSKLGCTALWLIGLFFAYGAVTAALNTPSTPVVVFGFLLGVTMGYALFETAKAIWRMK